MEARPQGRHAWAVKLGQVRYAAGHAHHEREGRSGDQWTGAGGKRPVVCPQLQTGYMGTAGNGEVASGEEVGHGRQRVDARRPYKPQRLADVLGMHNDFAEVGRGVP